MSKTGCEPLTLPTTSATTSVGMSCGMIATPPRRATVSAIRRPETAVMLATTSGSVVPIAVGAAQVDVEPRGDRRATRHHEDVGVGEVVRGRGVQKTHVLHCPPQPTRRAIAPRLTT